MRFERTITRVSCPNGHHRLGRVWGHGTYTRAGVTFQRYRCQPRAGRAHTFSVTKDASGDVRQSRRDDPPPCPLHPGSRRTLDGTHGGRRGPARQRYRCYGDGRPRGHSYVPTLPRAHVGLSDACEHCAQLLGRHAGEEAAGRQQGWSSLRIAEGLAFSSRGETYGETGRWATRVTTGWHGRDAPLTAVARPEAAESHRRWHIAADWVEIYSPVFWEPLDAELRANTLAERRRIDADRAAGLPLRRPMIWVADEHVVFGKSDELFSVLVVAEVEWLDGTEKPHLRLRIARAMPDRTTEAWALVFDELAGGSGEIWPDFVVADGGCAIQAAARQRFGDRVRWVPSLWHFGNRVRAAFLGKQAPRRRLDNDALEAHLDLLNRESEALASADGWRAWWDRLARLLPGSKWVASQRPAYEPAYLAVIPDLGSNRIPLSNAGLEELIKARIAPLFYKRSSFTSIERTNRLTDLAICRAHHRLDDTREVARAIRADAHAHAGWAAPLRVATDPANLDTGVRYRSLRDRSLSSRIATGRLA